MALSTRGPVRRRTRGGARFGAWVPASARRPRVAGGDDSQALPCSRAGSAWTLGGDDLAPVAALYRAATLVKGDWANSTGDPPG
jgi:hypothetical protein